MCSNEVRKDPFFLVSDCFKTQGMCFRVDVHDVPNQFHAQEMCDNQICEDS